MLEREDMFFCPGSNLPALRGPIFKYSDPQRTPGRAGRQNRGAWAAGRSPVPWLWDSGPGRWAAARLGKPRPPGSRRYHRPGIPPARGGRRLSRKIKTPGLSRQVFLLLIIQYQPNPLCLSPLNIPIPAILNNAIYPPPPTKLSRCFGSCFGA